MAVREINSTSGDRLFLNGSGGTLAGWGMMVVCRLMSLTSAQPIFAAVHAAATTQGVLYYDATNELSMGWASGDSNTTAFTLNTTDLWLLGFTKAAGTTVVRFHAANITTGAAASHANSGGTTGDGGSAWDQTEVGSADGGAFQGTKRIGTAAVFTSQYSDGSFDGVASAKTTQSIYNLTPSRAWDFNQAAVGTAVVNLMTGSNDQQSRTGTTVVTDTAFDAWTFGISAGGGPTVKNLAALGVG